MGNKRMGLVQFFHLGPKNYFGGNSLILGMEFIGFVWSNIFSSYCQKKCLLCTKFKENRSKL